MLENIFFYCSLCLHFFNLGYQDPTFVSQRDWVCNTCIRAWLHNPEINTYHSLEYIDEEDVSFDHRLLPIFHKAIEEKIQYAYEGTEPEDFRYLLPGYGGNPYCYSSVSKKLFNLLRDVHLFEREVQHVLEEQKQTILEKIAQKVEDLTQIAQKLGDIAKLTQRTRMGIEIDSEGIEENMKKMANMMRGRQQEARNSGEILVANETINSMKKYSKLIYESFIEYEKCWFVLLSGEKAEELLRILEEEFAERKLPTQDPGFEGILLKFDIAIEEFTKEIDQYFIRTRSEMLEKKVEQPLETLDLDL